MDEQDKPFHPGVIYTVRWYWVERGERIGDLSSTHHTLAEAQGEAERLNLELLMHLSKKKLKRGKYFKGEMIEARAGCELFQDVYDEVHSPEWDEKIRAEADRVWKAGWDGKPPTL